MALVPISREAHGAMRLKPSLNFDFARSLAAIRVLLGEVAQVQANYPIVFFKENDLFVPFAVMGLDQNENLFVSPTGQWLGYYVPAMLRRYPFMLARAPEEPGAAAEPNAAPAGDTAAGDQPAPQQARALLLVDDSTLSETEGEPLFGPESDEPKGPIARAIQMLTEIELQARHTAILSKSLVDQDLLDPLPLQVTRGTEEPRQLGGLFTVSEAKLNALPDEAFLTLRRSGALALAYAQLASLGQFPRLQARASAKMTNQPPPTA